MFATNISGIEKEIEGAQELDNTEPKEDDVLHDDWIGQVISTEAKPRKKPTRRKKKWKRQKNKQEHSNDKDIHKTQTKVPYHTERLIPSLTQLSITVVKQYWSARFPDLPHQIQAQFSSNIMQDATLSCLKSFHRAMEEDYKMQINCIQEKHYYLFDYPHAINRRTLYCPFYTRTVQQDEWSMANLPASGIPAWCTHRPMQLDLIPHNPIYTCFAAYLNLLLPPFLGKRNRSTKSKRANNSDEAAIRDAIAKIHENLQKEVPWNTATYFDFSLPYVYWARGNKLLAERYFRNVIAKSPSDSMTALLYNELGRLFIHFGDQHLAGLCFSTASDFTKYHAPPEKLAQIDLWQTILAASSNDQGFLTPASSDEACSSWDKIFEFNILSQGKYQADVSLMCFHFAHSPLIGINWWEAFDKILYRRSSYLALSLVKAMGGYNGAAQKYFQQHSTGPCPWIPIALAVKNHKQTIRPIQMLWRRLLPHPVIEEQKPAPLFDISHDDTSLWMTPDGYLTGDFQMLLPPMPSVKFNPYTGEIVHSLHLTPPGPWKSNILPSLDFQLRNWYHLPSQLRVYEDEQGRVVDLYIVNFIGNMRCGETVQIILKWKCNHKEARLDLKKEIRSLMRKQLEHPFYIQKYSDCPENTSVYLESVEKCHKYGYSLHPYDVGHAHQLFCNEKANLDQLKRDIKATNDQKVKKRLKKKLDHLVQNYKKSIPKFHISLQSFASFGKALVIAFGSEPDQSRESFFFVFNCEDEPSLRNFKYHVLSPEEKKEWNWGPVNEYDIPSSGLASAPSGQGRHYPEASVFVVPRWRIKHFSQKYWSSFTVFNEEGQELTKVMEYNSPESETVYRDLKCVIGHKLFSIHPNNKKVVSHDAVLEICHQSGTLSIIASLSMLGRFLLVQTVAGVYILNEALEPLHWCTERINHCIQLSDDGTRIQGDFSNISVLSCDRLTSDTDDKVWRIILAADDQVLLLRLFAGKTKSDSLICNTVVQVPGTPKEAIYVNETVGFFVASTISDEHEQYHEELYQFSIKGELIGLLPFLGRGPHKYLPVFLSGNEKAARERVDPTLAAPSWYIYCFDGYGALCCIKPL